MSTEATDGAWGGAKGPCGAPGRVAPFPLLVVSHAGLRVEPSALPLARAFLLEALGPQCLGEPLRQRSDGAAVVARAQDRARTPTVAGGVAGTKGPRHRRPGRR